MAIGDKPRLNIKIMYRNVKYNQIIVKEEYHIVIINIYN